MTFNMQAILGSKRALHRAHAARPIGEKLRMPATLRERELAIRGRTPLSESSILREVLAPRCLRMS